MDYSWPSILKWNLIACACLLSRRITILHPNDFKMVIWCDETRDKSLWDGHANVIGQYEGCTLALNGHDPFRRALSYQAYLAHENSRLPPEARHEEFGTPPSNFISLRSQLKENYQTSYREEVVQELMSDGSDD